MENKYLRDRAMIWTIFLFIIGESSIFSVGLGAKRDLWISIIISIIISCIISLIYIKLSTIFFNKNIIDIIFLCFNRYLATILVILLVYYAIFLAEVAMIDYGQFMSTMFFNRTPSIIFTGSYMLLAAIFVKSSEDGIFKWGEFLFLIPITMLILVIIGTLKIIDFKNISPIFENGITPIIRNAFDIAQFPFCEIIVFTMVLDKFKEKKSPKRVYIKSIVYAGIFIFLDNVDNILVLGIDGIATEFYPSHLTATRAEFGAFIRGIEALASCIYILGGFVKICICIWAACKGVASIFKLKEYRYFVMPISLIIYNLTFMDFKTIFNYQYFGNIVYPKYAYFFQIIVPLIVLIKAYTHKRKEKTRM